MLSTKDYEEIRAFIMRNARPLELSLWNYHFEGKDKEVVLDALRTYQCENGGFGNVIEPDNWNPESTPYTITFVLDIFRQIDFYDMSHPFYKGIFDFLLYTPHQSNYGWSFTVPDNDKYPHAIWWSYSEEANKTQNFGTTASLCGFILRYVDCSEPIYERATKYTHMLLDRLKSEKNLGDMGVLSLCSLYTDLNSANLNNQFYLDFLEQCTRSLFEEHFHEYVWNNHQDMACALPNPSSFYYSGHEQDVANAIDELIRIRPQNGVWDVPWEWYDNGKYAREFAISENWWRSIKAMEKMLFLKAHGAINNNS